MTFKERVLEAVRKIQKGETKTYKEVAAAAGNARAARAVGAIMRTNHDRSIPCHRVVRGDGRLGGYNGLLGLEKHELLSLERCG